MRYIYYDPVTMQVEAEFDTPYLSHQSNWLARGLQRAIVPDGMSIHRDCKVEVSMGDDGESVCVSVAVSLNPVQRDAYQLPRTRIDDLNDKLDDDTISDAEIRELLRLKRSL